MVRDDSKLLGDNGHLLMMDIYYNEVVSGLILNVNSSLHLTEKTN